MIVYTVVVIIYIPTCDVHNLNENIDTIFFLISWMNSRDCFRRVSLDLHRGAFITVVYIINALGRQIQYFAKSRE